MTATSISRRIEASIQSLSSKDYEAAFIHLFPAIDKTAKKRRPKDGVGQRIKSFISDEEKIISAVATNNIFRNIQFDDIDFPTALYKLGVHQSLMRGNSMKGFKLLKMTVFKSVKFGACHHPILQALLFLLLLRQKILEKK